MAISTIRIPSNPITNFAKWFGLGVDVPGSGLFKAGKAATAAKAIPKGTVLPKKAVATKPTTIASKLPKPTVKNVAVGGALAGGGYVGYKAATGAGEGVYNYFNPEKKTHPGGDLPYDPTAVDIARAGQPGFGDYFGKGLGEGAGAIGEGLGKGISAIPEGAGANIVPLAVVIGALYLGTQYMKKPKRKGRK